MAKKRRQAAALQIYLQNSFLEGCCVRERHRQADGKKAASGRRTPNLV
jgi:hypothetical protein